MELKIGRMVVGMREKMRWSRATLANAAGTGRATRANVHSVRRIELDLAAPSLADASRIAHAFGLSVEVFVPSKVCGVFLADDELEIPQPKTGRDRYAVPVTNKTFGEKLLYLRERKRMTQPKLSARSGVPIATIAKYEGGHIGGVRLSVAVLLADVLGVGLSEFEGCEGVRRRVREKTTKEKTTKPPPRKRGRRARK